MLKEEGRCDAVMFFRGSDARERAIDYARDGFGEFQEYFCTRAQQGHGAVTFRTVGVRRRSKIWTSSAISSNAACRRSHSLRGSASAPPRQPVGQRPLRAAPTDDGSDQQRDQGCGQGHRLRPQAPRPEIARPGAPRPRDFFTDHPI